MAVKVAATQAPVFITGESGTGKEVLARYIHAHSDRAHRPLVSVNCAALPPSLIESELFGHERGAFTGAIRDKMGHFEEAHTGTLFLDELTEIEPYLQAKLLRVIQEQEIRRVGATRPQPVDVRVIAASNRDLHEAVASGRLREDLYYRLRVVELRLPPLRERMMDLRSLCEHFLAKYAGNGRSALTSVSPASLERMQAYSWPGNIRELENVVRRATVLAAAEDGELILPAHLPTEIGGGHQHLPVVADRADLDLGAAVERTTRAYLDEALRRAGGNRTEAARLLGVSRRTLYNLLDSTFRE
jgi:transcriptional regulator with PAS, ATPase and Fis domain